MGKSMNYYARMVLVVLVTVLIMDPIHGNVVMKEEGDSDAHQIIQTCAQPRINVVVEHLYVVKWIAPILVVIFHALNLMKMSARKPMMTSTTMMMMLSMTTTMMIWTTKTTMRMMLWMATMMTMIWRKKLLWRKKTLQNSFGKIHN